MMIFYSTNYQKRNLTQLLKALEFPQLIPMELFNTVILQMKKVNWKRFYNRDTKNKSEELNWLHFAMKEKLANGSITEKLQILTSVTDCWSQKYCSEYFGVSKYFIQSARELMQRKEIIAQPSQKKVK